MTLPPTTMTVDLLCSREQLRSTESAKKKAEDLVCESFSLDGSSFPRFQKLEK